MPRKPSRSRHPSVTATACAPAFLFDGRWCREVMLLHSHTQALRNDDRRYGNCGYRSYSLDADTTSIREQSLVFQHDLLDIVQKFENVSRANQAAEARLAVQRIFFAFETVIDHDATPGGGPLGLSVPLPVFKDKRVAV